MARQQARLTAAEQAGEEGPECTSHPAAAFSHPAPITNQGITFALFNIAGVVSSVCPGNYQLTTNLPQAGHIFLTATAGLLTPGDACPAAEAGSGTRYASAGAQASWSNSLSFTCAQLTGQASVLIQVTYATGVQATFQTNSITMPVDQACTANACANQPSPTPPSPTPPPTQRPVYPSCIGATPLPDPAPLGKACFYDKECKVQCEDTRNPNCATAAALPCPPPKGKCCFYDSQCQVQCEDLGNTKCPKPPACNVPGCSQCSASNPDVCLACNAGTGYSLNVASLKCECMHGYAGSSSCAKCPAGSVSAGGKLPTAACKACPAGRVANPAASECVVPSSWEHWGYDLTNRRFAYSETKLNTSTAPGLVKRWSFSAGGDLSATPTVVAGRLYVPDWNGNLWCLNASTSAVIWTKKILDYVLAVDPNPYPSGYTSSNIISRTSPAWADGKLILGVMKKGGGFPYLLAVNAADGSLAWCKRVDPHPAAMLTQSPTVYNGAVYVGVSSLEELWANSATYPCCTFIGSMLKVDLAGNILWRTLMAPDNNGQTGAFSGNSVWGSSPAVDVARNQVYIATGNNYEIPDDLADCIKAIGPLHQDNILAQVACESKYPTNYHNSMLALDLDSGKVRWVKQLGGPDAWNAACMYGGNAASCPDINSPDYDFAQAPMLVTACKGCRCKQLVVAGQKSGWLWALAPDTGAVHWSLPVGPGGTVGGLQWGSAADTSRIYVANNNYLSVPINLSSMKAVPNKLGSNAIPATTQGGIAAAVDAYDGNIVWTFANPTPHWGDVQAGVNPPKEARSQAPMTVANGVVFYASMDLQGTLFTLNAATGKLLNVFATGMTTGCGPAVVDGRVYIGSGYANFGLGLNGNQLHMLSTAADVPPAPAAKVVRKRRSRRDPPL
uniref:Pyrrolo-quinoline quinone repeat domain-containing protein n=1 Tax=Tetradesmus obliquus TaxID=3088 RepID=A0A383VAH7_TETOB|eukprot:jgi/Sobl393_1/18183/SZX62201.1